MKKLFVFLIIFSMFTTVCFAESAGIEMSPVEEMIEDLFARNFKLYDLHGLDVTEAFYREFQADYENGYYNNIINFLEHELDRAEYHTAFGGQRSSSDAVRVYKSFHAVLDDEIHGYADWNQVYGTVRLDYVVNNNEGEIVSASNPTITAIDTYDDHGDADAVITVSNRRYVIASNKLKVTFSFHVRVDEYVVSSMDYLPISFRYNTDFSFVEYAP